jgi:hypothetical protein
MNSKISIFKNFSSPAVAFKLSDWMRVCKHGDKRYTPKVELCRETTDPDELKRIKETLPLATVGAVCEGGRSRENVVIRTGWIALDIDGKDNPGMDAEQLRDELAKIQNVAFSGLSVSGKGVWALVKVKHPDRQAEHFEMLLKDFEKFGIILDSSKGRNPNDARFYSYDPDAVIKSEFTVYEKLPLLRKKSNPAPVKTANTSKYADAAFTDELRILSHAGNGNRNNQLFKSAASLAGFVAGGMLDEYDVRAALEQAAQSIGLKSHEIKSTLRSGFDAGFASPRTPDSNGALTGISGYGESGDKPSAVKFESQKSETDQKIDELKQADPIVAELLDNWSGEIENPEDL